VTEPRAGSARILIVDDEPAVRRFAARALLEEGFLVQEAGDGVEALGLIRTMSVSVVVTDVVMPRLNGVELLRELSATYPDLPVILMSGYAAAQLEGMGIAAPCGILVKPFGADRLVEEVWRCLPGAGPVRVSGSNGVGL
jgi:two-component system cell cycle sensor histidine kinase/response regulator CckA